PGRRSRKPRRKRDARRSASLTRLRGLEPGPRIARLLSSLLAEIFWAFPSRSHVEEYTIQLRDWCLAVVGPLGRAFKPSAFRNPFAVTSFGTSRHPIGNLPDVHLARATGRICRDPLAGQDRQGRNAGTREDLGSAGGTLHIARTHARRDLDYQIDLGVILATPAAHHDVRVQDFLGFVLAEVTAIDGRLEQLVQVFGRERACAPDQSAKVCGRPFAVAALQPFSLEVGDIDDEALLCLVQIAHPDPQSGNLARELVDRGGHFLESALGLGAQGRDLLGQGQQLLRQDETAQLRSPLRLFLQDSDEVPELLHGERHGDILSFRGTDYRAGRLASWPDCPQAACQFGAGTSEEVPLTELLTACAVIHAIDNGSALQ